MPHNVAHHDKSPKNKRNPKPSPIGNNFGFLSFGSPCWARTSACFAHCDIRFSRADAWLNREFFLARSTRAFCKQKRKTSRIMMAWWFEPNGMNERKADRLLAICFLLAPPTGLEPVTSWLTVMRSTDWAMEEYERDTRNSVSLCVGYDLSFRSVSRQVFSALQSLTSVFEMGTGGPFALKTLTCYSLE